MKKLSAALAGLLLASCAATGTGTGTTINSTDVLNQIAAYTEAYCKFEPTLASLDTIVTTATGTLFPAGAAISQVVNSVGSAICAAPPSAAFGRAGTQEIVRIVTIPGGPAIPVHGVAYTARSLRHRMVHRAALRPSPQRLE